MVGCCWLAAAWDRTVVPRAPAPGVPVLGEQHPQALLELRLWQRPLFVVGPRGSDLLHGSLSTLALVSGSSACCRRLP